MAQNPQLWAGRREGGSSAEEGGWNNKEGQQRRRWRWEEVGGFGKVSGSGRVEAVAVDGDEDDDGAADDGKDGGGGDAAPVAPRCHIACSPGIQTQSEELRRPPRHLSVHA